MNKKTSNGLSAEQVASFLSEHTDFFTQHADVFAQLQVPQPHAPGTLSLLERQVQVMRQRERQLQWQLSELLYCADENKEINDTVTHWCANLLSVQDAQQIPAEIVSSLQQAFPELEVVLRVWNVAELADSPLQTQSEGLLSYVQSLDKPYCGVKLDESLADCFATAPGSIAVVPLRQDEIALGVLLFASDNPEHFHESMGLVFLKTLGQLAGAALSRLQSKFELT